MFRARALTALFWVGCLLGGTNALAQDDEPLPPQKVFVYTTAADAQKVYLRFAVLDGYYLYRARFGFASATNSVTLRDAEFPKGETHTDEYFGAQEIYRGKFEIAIPYQRTAAADTLALNLKLQGCADHGICYIPQSWNAKIKLPAGPVATLAPDPFAPAQKKFAASPVVAATDDLLPVDQAFVLNARFDKPNELTVGWQIAPGHYLYRDKLVVPRRRQDRARPRVVAEGQAAQGRELRRRRGLLRLRRGEDSVRTCERECARRRPDRGVPRLPREQRLLSAERADDGARAARDVGVSGRRGRGSTSAGGPVSEQDRYVAANRQRLVVDDARLCSSSPGSR